MFQSNAIYTEAGSQTGICGVSAFKLLSGDNAFMFLKLGEKYLFSIFETLTIQWRIQVVFIPWHEALTPFGTLHTS